MQDSYRCLEISVLKRPRSDEAKQLLDRVAKQVQPIMRKRRWTVKKLSEFSPRNPGLLGLNVNRGAEVKIRLRPARDEESFYDWNHILGTMLHELCHIEIGPHNSAFYKLLDELWCEAEDLMDRGITGSGTGFDAPSAGRLGSHTFIPTHNPPPHKMADAIRKAAEARAAQQAVMPSGPRKLGTSGAAGFDYRRLTPAQAAARAAEQRARDNVWCGAEHSADEVEREVGQQAESLPSPGPSSNAAAAAAPAALRAAAGVMPGQPAATQPGASLRPTGAAQQQQQQQQPLNDNPQPQPQHQQQRHVVSQQQQLALHQQWQQHLQQQHSQRQRTRKRPAVETVDLTLSDSGDEAGPSSAAAAVGRGAGPSIEGAPAGPGMPALRRAGRQAGTDVADSCPCCAAAVQGPLDAAVMARLSSRQGGRCAAHMRLQQDQEQLQGKWACSVCTLINPASVFVCEACLTLKNMI